MNGIEFLSKIKMNDPNAIIIIIITGCRRKSVNEMVERIGIYAILKKPLNVLLLIDTLNSINNKIVFSN